MTKRVTIDIDSGIVTFNRAVEIAEALAEEQSQFKVKTERQQNRDSATIESSMNRINLLKLGEDIEVTISGQRGFVIAVKEEMEKEVDMKGKRQRDEDVGNRFADADFETVNDPGPAPQAEIEVMDDGRIEVKIGTGTDQYDTLMGVFIDKNANVAEAYSIDNIEQIAGELEAKKAVDSFAEYVSDVTGIDKRRLM